MLCFVSPLRAWKDEQAFYIEHFFLLVGVGANVLPCIVENVVFSPFFLGCKFDIYMLCKMETSVITH